MIGDIVTTAVTLLPPMIGDIVTTAVTLSPPMIGDIVTTAVTLSPPMFGDMFTTAVTYQNFTTPGFEPGIFGIAAKFLDNWATNQL